MSARKDGWWIAGYPHLEFSANQPFQLKTVSIDPLAATDTLPIMSASTAFPRASLLFALALAGGCNLITGAGDLVVEADLGNGGGGGDGGRAGSLAATTGAGAAGGGATTATTGAGAGTSSSHASSSAASSSHAASSSSSSAASSSSSSGSTDPFDAAAQLCVDTINM